VWRRVLKKGVSVRLALWPFNGIVDENVLKGEEYLNATIQDIRKLKDKMRLHDEWKTIKEVHKKKKKRGFWSDE
jgi:hypothetical protein